MSDNPRIRLAKLMFEDIRGSFPLEDDAVKSALALTLAMFDDTTVNWLLTHKSNELNTMDGVDDRREASTVTIVESEYIENPCDGHTNV